MPYLTLKQYCDRFGVDDIIRSTNDRVSAPVDPADLKQYVDGNEPSPSADILIIQATFDSIAADSDAFIDTFLRAGGYVLPFQTPNDVPLVLTAKASDVYRYELHNTMATEQVTRRYDQCVAWLKDLRQGHADLGLEADGDHAKREGGPAFRQTTGRVFANQGELDAFLGKDLC